MMLRSKHNRSPRRTWTSGQPDHRQRRQGRPHGRQGDEEDRLAPYRASGRDRGTPRAARRSAGLRRREGSPGHAAEEPARALDDRGAARRRRARSWHQAQKPEEWTVGSRPAWEGLPTPVPAAPAEQPGRGTTRETPGRPRRRPRSRRRPPPRRSLRRTDRQDHEHGLRKTTATKKAAARKPAAKKPAAARKTTTRKPTTSKKKET